MPADRLTADLVTCKFFITYERSALTSEAELLAVATAVAKPLPLRIVADLCGGQTVRR